ncbi:MAG TPA: hypothetical protein V6C86_24340 [Oculatellaceae cyanobacterium]
MLRVSTFDLNAGEITRELQKDFPGALVTYEQDPVIWRQYYQLRYKGDVRDLGSMSIPQALMVAETICIAINKRDPYGWTALCKKNRAS